MEPLIEILVAAIKIFFGETNIMQKLLHTALNFYVELFYLLFEMGGGHMNLKKKHNLGKSPGLLQY